MAKTLVDNTPTRVAELVVNLDDTTGEVMSHCCDVLLGAGALDVWTSPITMKRGRPGVMLSVLAEVAAQEKMARLMLSLTGSFGVRTRPWDRLVLDREWVETTTRFGPVRLKVGRLGGAVVSVKPEFADVETMAGLAGISITQAMTAAQAQADAWRASEGGQGG